MQPTSLCEKSFFVMLCLYGNAGKVEKNVSILLTVIIDLFEIMKRLKLIQENVFVPIFRYPLLAV